MKPVLRLCSRYRKQLYRQISKRLGSEDDAQYILDIYFPLWNNRQQIIIDNSLLPYLSRSAHYAIIDHYLFHKKRFVMETTLAKREENKILMNMRDAFYLPYCPAAASKTLPFNFIFKQVGGQMKPNNKH